MKTSIATVSLSGSLTEKLHACAAAGFDGVEMFEPDLIANDHSPEEIRALAAGWVCRSTCTSRFATSRASTSDTFADNLRRAGRHLRHGAAPRHRHRAGLQQRRDRDRRLRRGVRRPAAPARRPGRRATTSRSPSRRWLGAASSTTTGGRGASRSWPTIPTSGSAWTASTCCPADTTPPPSRTSRPRRSSSCSSPTRPR